MTIKMNKMWGIAAFIIAILLGGISYGGTQGPSLKEIEDKIEKNEESISGLQKELGSWNIIRNFMVKKEIEELKEENRQLKLRALRLRSFTITLERVEMRGIKDGYLTAYFRGGKPVFNEKVKGSAIFYVNRPVDREFNTLELMRVEGSIITKENLFSVIEIPYLREDGRAQRYIPEELFPRQPGEKKITYPFDGNFISVTKVFLFFQVVILNSLRESETVHDFRCQF